MKLYKSERFKGEEYLLINKRRENFFSVYKKAKLMPIKSDISYIIIVFLCQLENRTFFFRKITVCHIEKYRFQVSPGSNEFKGQ